MYIGCFYSLCRIGLYYKQVQHGWSISQMPCTSSVVFPSVVPRMYLPRLWGYCFYLIFSLLRSRCACWMIRRCLDRLLNSFGIGPAVAMRILRWVLVWCRSGLNNVTDAFGAEINKEVSFRYAVISSRLLFMISSRSGTWLMWLTWLGHQHNRPVLPIMSVSAWQ